MGVLVAWEGVGVEGPEDVTDPGAGDGLQHAATLPHAERHLQILPTPNLKRKKEITTEFESSRQY